MLFSTIDFNDKPIFFEIKSGENFSEVLIKLKKQGLVENILPLKIYARLTKKGTKIQAGEYLLEGVTNLSLIIDRFITGEVFLHPFTIIEGLTASELEQDLRASVIFADKDVDLNLNLNIDWDQLSADSFVFASKANIEGLFLPETYLFPRSTPIAMVLQDAHNSLLKALNEEWNNRADNLPLYSPYEGLILASIIEKETAVADERTRIASVFIKRLKLNMRLQTDPTVIYGLGSKFDGNLTRSNLRLDTPYNTYTRKGLPPSPIALPGRDSIRAAFNPSDEEYIYFVATGDEDGRHKFSKDIDEHNLAVKEYLDKIKFKEGKEK
ncbi:MAG: UPF0755 protein [Woeseiaceae bacterium]|jgi:UPF0755 protein|tara:strand:+ start:50913 stop:51887 length:975 start_codon:yes stop_codon:yes gene_type:complete